MTRPELSTLPSDLHHGLERQSGSPASHGAPWRVVVGAGVVGLAVGLSAGVLLGGEGLGGAEVNADLETTCQYAESFDFEPSEFRPDQPLVWQVSATAQLTVAAGMSTGDDDLQDVGYLLMGALQGSDIDDLGDALAELDRYCE